jgi:hypothetical protein
VAMTSQNPHGQPPDPAQVMDYLVHVSRTPLAMVTFHNSNILEIRAKRTKEQPGIGANMVAAPAGYDDLLERPLHGHLATARPDCSVPVSPMWFDLGA